MNKCLLCSKIAKVKGFCSGCNTKQYYKNNPNKYEEHLVSNCLKYHNNKAERNLRRILDRLEPEEGEKLVAKINEMMKND